MTSRITLVVFAGSLLAQQTNWIAAGNHALDKGSPEEAAADFAQALDEHVRAGASAKDLLHLRVTLATAHMEAGAYREMEAVLQEAQKTANQLTDGVSRAELLNAWSALHLKLGKLSAAEAELRYQLSNSGSTIRPRFADSSPADVLNLNSKSTRCTLRSGE